MRTHTRAGVSVAIAAMVAITAAGCASDEPASSDKTLRIAVTGNSVMLPLFVGIESGEFAKAGLELETEVYQGASTTQVPRLVRGDIDLLPATASPSFFNSSTEGFDVKAVLSAGTTGDAGTPSLVVLGDAVNKIHDYEDLRGYRVDGGAVGTVLQLQTAEALTLGGLTGDDVELTMNGKTPADILALAKNNAADVISTIEPIGSQIESLGLGKRWKVMNETAPWFPQMLILSSSETTKEKAAAIDIFAEVYLKMIREINAQDGEWSDKYVSAAEKWTGQEEEDITATPLPQFDETGVVSTDNLQRIQDVWVEQGLVETKADVKTLVDTGFADRAKQ